MKILVTGANGFLGRHVVSALVQRGCHVRAMVRPAARVEHLGWSDHVEVIRADLRAPRNLLPAFEDVDALVHLAAGVTGAEEDQFVSTVVGTERLLDAMAHSATRRLVLASSFSVYDWSEIEGVLNEDSPLEADLYTRDGYAIAKHWQERVTRRLAQEHHWDLTVLRPGFIWGKGNEYLACLGQRLGRLHLTIAPFSRIPLTHVLNCADAFALAALDPRAIGQTFNVVDSDAIRIGRYFRAYRRGKGLLSIPIPYAIGYAITQLATLTSRAIFHGKGKLPSLLVPCRYEARFKPLRYDNARLQTLLGWRPPYTFRECLRLTYGPPATCSAVPSESLPVGTPLETPVRLASPPHEPAAEPRSTAAAAR